MEIHLRDRFFSVEIRFYFSFFTENLYFKILTRIYQSKASRTLEPFSRYSQRWKIHPHSGSQLRNLTPDLMDFHVLRFSGKSKKENEKIYIYILARDF